MEPFGKPNFSLLALALFLAGTAVVFYGAYSYFGSAWAATICVVILLPLSAAAYVLVRRLLLRRNAEV